MTGPALSRAQVLVAAALFATGGAAIKLCALSSWQIAGYRSGVAAVLLWLALPGWRQFWRPAPLAVGCAYAATLILYVTANTLTTAANSIFLQTTAPLYLLLLGPWLLGERNRQSDLAVAALLAAGLALFFAGPEPALRTAPDPLRGNLVAAASGLSWALTLVGLRWLGRQPREGSGDPTGAAVVAGNALAFLVCLPLALPAGGAAARDVGIVLYLGACQIALAYTFMVRGVRGLRALEVSLLLVLEPVLNALLAWAVHGERPAPQALAGCALVLVALLGQALRRP